MGDTYPSMDGRARRLIDLRREDAGVAIGWLEDDFHHFGVTIEHDPAEVVTDVRTAAPRYPFTTCPAAGSALRGMIGHQLSARASDVGEMVSMRSNCTHMFDLAGLVMAFAHSRRSSRRYEAVVDDREIVKGEPSGRRVFGPGAARLYCDGDLVLEWFIDRGGIVGPAPWAGQSLMEGFRQRTEAMPVVEAEHATVLRRTIAIASGRSVDLDLFPTARERGHRGTCHTFLDENIDQAMRVMGSTRNYEQSSQGMLSHRAAKP